MNIDLDKIWPPAASAAIGGVLVWALSMLKRGIGSEARAPVWNRLDEHRDEIAELKERIIRVETNQGNNDKTIEKLGEKIDALPEHVDRKLDAMEKRIIEAVKRD